MPTELFTKDCIKQLAAAILAEMPELAQILEEWPESNVELQYPCLSIITRGEAEHRPFPPYEVSTGEETDHVAEVLYVVGDYELKLQLDLWCESKEQRHQLYEAFYRAFNSQWPVMGLSLSLTGYHNTICRYDLTSYRADDDEASSQRKEWRVKMNVLASSKALLAREEYIIETAEVVSEEISESQIIP